MCFAECFLLVVAQQWSQMGAEVRDEIERKAIEHHRRRLASRNATVRNCLKQIFSLFQARVLNVKELFCP